MNAKQLLIHVAEKHNFKYKAMIKAIRQHEPLSDDDTKETEAIDTQNYITCLDDNYPAEWKHYELRFLAVHKKGDIADIRKQQHWVYVEGENKLNIPTDRIITTDKNNVLHIGKNLTLWTTPKDNDIRLLGISLSSMA